MTTSASSKSNRIWDPIRQREVIATPEERVRQHLVAQMLALDYPRALLSIERRVSSVGRRYDLLCHYKQDGELRPLLAIECKAEPDQAALSQIRSYNETLEAPFLGVADRTGLTLSWREGESWRSLHGLPTYQSLINSII